MSINSLEDLLDQYDRNLAQLNPDEGDKLAAYGHKLIVHLGGKGQGTIRTIASWGALVPGGSYLVTVPKIDEVVRVIKIMNAQLRSYLIEEGKPLTDENIHMLNRAFQKLFSLAENYEDREEDRREDSMNIRRVANAGVDILAAKVALMNPEELFQVIK